MERRGLSKQTDIAWLILGYLSCYPDAKDTVEGIQKWWLSGIEDGIDARRVQLALDDLMKAGWLLSSERRGTETVYGLNAHRRNELLHILQPHAYGQES